VTTALNCQKLRSLLPYQNPEVALGK